jgi:hypothetical protein
VAATATVVCLVVESTCFPALHKLVPGLRAALVADKEVNVKKGLARVNSRDNMQRCLTDFTHVSDRRIRFLIDAVIDMKSNGASASCNDERLRWWTARRSEAIDEPLPPRAAFSAILRRYLHHMQDVSPPPGGLGGMSSKLAQDFFEARDRTYLRYPLQKLRWSDFTYAYQCVYSIF